MKMRKMMVSQFLIVALNNCWFITMNWWESRNWGWKESGFAGGFRARSRPLGRSTYLAATWAILSTVTSNDVAAQQIDNRTVTSLLLICRTVPSRSRRATRHAHCIYVLVWRTRTSIRYGSSYRCCRPSLQYNIRVLYRVYPFLDSSNPTYCNILLATSGR